ncbi:uncharacterized protein LOC116417987 [Nasonia vitripennis]|uniref:Uncharacterized protein n=1 Tax=Nasonia vitripennis TaxID=7425 RepID=A0A7M7QKY2_NASVI|nr:uncharacterized protein LOC116417987 [Nasonia vitripennis]
MSPRKVFLPKKILKSDYLYTKLLSKLKKFKIELLNDGEISINSLKDVIFSLYNNVDDKILEGFYSWIKNNVRRLVVDLEEYHITKPALVEAPINKINKYRFNKFADAISQLCSTPDDFTSVIKHNISEVCAILYGPYYDKRYEKFVKRYSYFHRKDLIERINLLLDEEELYTTACDFTPIANRSSDPKKIQPQQLNIYNTPSRVLISVKKFDLSAPESPEKEGFDISNEDLEYRSLKRRKLN